MKRDALIHIGVWAFLLLFPLVFYNPDDTMAQTWGRTLRAAGGPLSYMALFYVNYLWLIPKVYFKGRKREFLIINAALVVVGVGLVLGWHNIIEALLPDNFMKRPPAEPIEPRPHKHMMPPPPLQTLFFYNILSLILTVGLSLALRLTQRNNQLEQDRLEAEQRRSEAELSNLRNQLNPHFLLNTLNNIYALISFDTDKAQLAVSELSKMLRYLLYDNQSNYVPLYKEMQFITNYIELMKIRVTSQVEVNTRIDIAPDDATPVAPLIIISLIENAFKHGISSSGTGQINVNITKEDGIVTCAISNTNHPKRNNDKSGSGIGLKQVERRLQLLYPGRHTWQRGVSPDGTMYNSVITIKI